MRFPFLSKSVEHDQQSVLGRSIAPVVEELEGRRLFALSVALDQDPDGNEILRI